MDIAYLIDSEVMQHLATFGFVKNMDAFALHMLKNSEHPVLKFRRAWMRQEALRQHLEAERNQLKLNETHKWLGHRQGADMRREAKLDTHLMSEMVHYNKAPITEQIGEIKSEAPRIFKP